MLTATSTAAPLPAGTEQRLQQFAKLVAAALANGQARDELRALADEQAALRGSPSSPPRKRPSTRCSRPSPCRRRELAGVDFTTLLRFEPDGSTEIVALDGAPGDIRTGMRAPAGGDGAVQRVWRTGRAARIDDLARDVRPLAADRRTTSASPRASRVPILLERRLWGALVVVGRDATRSRRRSSST